MIIIGSRCINYHFSDFPRTPKDWDYLVEDKSKYKSSKEVEYHENPILWDFLTKHDGYLEPDIILTLKCSHIFWDINFYKHLHDITFLFEKGCKINKQLFNELYQYWNKIHGYNRRSDLTLNAKDFFNNALKTYDHDYLHTLINPKPTYKKILRDGEEVDVDENKFNNLSFEDKCNLVYEEVYIMAWERYYKLSYRAAYAKMLKKFIMNHAPMFEVFFILENYRKLSSPQYNFFKILEEKTQQNEIN